MAEQPHRRPLSGPATAAAVAVTTLLLAVVSASTRTGSATPPRPPGWSEMAAAGRHGATALVIALVPIVFVVGLSLWVLAQMMARKRRTEQRILDPHYDRRRRLKQAIFAGSILLVAVLARLGVIDLNRIHLPAFGESGSGGGGGVGGLAHHNSGSQVGTVDWLAAAVLWLVMIVVAVLLYRRFRQAPRTVTPAAVVAEPVAEPRTPPADLRANPDARQAVIATYAEMERELGEHRLERDAAEGPREYLGRVIGHLRISRPALRRLTSLYEQARFSVHPVDRTMQDQAVDSLEEMQSDLEAEER
ncbi:MAG TPA: DUF4129 domain-containing protein [Gaiellales bacterium]|jgi:hypothetical protein|nr:DUF4129 domain-containing protein [Gaiellales bacterium]